MRIYIVVNNSLKMGKGKVVAQVGHGISRITEHMVGNEADKWKRYIDSGERKIIVKANVDDFNSIRELYNNCRDKPVWCYSVVDAGLTQIPTGSLTCLVFIPLEEEDVPLVLKNLKLY